MTHKIGHIT